VPVSPEDIFNYSKEIKQIAQPREIEYRSGTSKAYYACYHKAHSMLENKVAFSAASHDSFTCYLKASAHLNEDKLSKNELKTLSYKLINIKTLRTLADYRTTEEVDKRVYDEALALCEDFFLYCNDIIQ